MKKFRIIFGWTAIIVVSIYLLFLGPTEKKIRNIRLGYSDDTSSFVINYMEKQDYFEKSTLKRIMEPQAIRDC